MKLLETGYPLLAIGRYSARLSGCRWLSFIIPLVECWNITLNRPRRLHSISFPNSFTIKMTVFWVPEPCSLAEVYLLASSIIRAMSHRPDDGGSKHLWNICKLLSDYTALLLRRQTSQYSPPWELETLLIHNHSPIWCSWDGVVK
jgi:hypothetical protein